eukprot:scaffold19547_cov66-Phaeocystis_antarctica.AAC.6
MVSAGNDVNHSCRRHVERLGLFNALRLDDLVMISEHLQHGELLDRGSGIGTVEEDRANRRKIGKVACRFTTQRVAAEHPRGHLRGRGVRLEGTGNAALPQGCQTQSHAQQEDGQLGEACDLSAQWSVGEVVDEGARKVCDAVRVRYAGGGHEENVAPGQLDGLRIIRGERVLRAVEGLLQIAVDFHGSVDNEKEQEEEERRDALDEHTRERRKTQTRVERRTDLEGPSFDARPPFAP